jgi:photosystem II stability/assembly factor-like uncharacterized protein
MKQLLPYVANWLLLLGTTIPAVAQTTSPWVEVPAFSATGGYYITINDIQLPSNQAIWALCIDPRGMGPFTTTVFASADDGRSWDRVRMDGSERNLAFAGAGTDVKDLWALDAQQAWAIFISYPSYTKQLQHTTTGPRGFAEAPTQIPGNPQLVRFFTPITGIVLREQQNTDVAWPLYRTTDGGLSWQSIANSPLIISDPTKNYLDSGYLNAVVIGTYCWLTVGHNQLLHTTDAGLTWTSSITPASFTGITFRDAQHGLAYSRVPSASGDMIRLYRTSDSGMTWQLLAPVGKPRSLKIAAVPGSAGTYVSIGGGGDVGSSISYDEGQTWQELDNTLYMSALVADASGRIFASYPNVHEAKLVRLTNSVLAAIAPQTASTSAYPNPTTGRVQLPAAGAYRQVAVLDAAGRQCRTTKLGLSETTLDLSSLGAGIYLLRLDGGTAPAQHQRLVVAP